MKTPYIPNGKEWSEILQCSTLSALLFTHTEGRKAEEQMPEIIGDLKAASEEASMRFERTAANLPRNAPRIDYLSHHRKIHKERVKNLSDSLKIGLNELHVKTYLPDQSGKWLHTGLMSYEGSRPSKKHFARGLPKGWAVVSSGSQDKQVLLFCESPIDGLSYAELKGLSHYTIIASCGRPSKAQTEGLKLLAKNQHEKIILSDNDESGRKLAEELRAVLETAGNDKVPIKTPTKGKDFNELLITAKANSRAKTKNLGRQK